MALYPMLKAYQKELVDKNLDLIDKVFKGDTKPLRRQISVSPTGSGKTFMMASIIECGLRSNDDASFVWLTHNKQILYQTQNEIMEALGSTVIPVYSIEQNIQSYGGRVLLLNVQKGVSAKSIDWLANWKKYQKRSGRKVIFIIDEADEGMSGKNMQGIKEVVEPILELGFTASFKKKEDEAEFYRVPYKDVIDAGMLVRSIEYQASEEVSREEMMSRAIAQRDHLETIARRLKFIDRYFTPKMLIQTQAQEAEFVAKEIKDYLGLSNEKFAEQVVVHTQNSRGLEQVEDMSEVRYIIGDLMVERGWNCPEAYVLLSTKDSVSEAKGIQLLGRVIRLPKAEPFDDVHNEFNRGYVYISGRHSIEKSAQKFADQDVNPLPPPKEVIQVDRNTTIKIPEMLTFIDELDKDYEDKDLRPITKNICDIIQGMVKKCNDSGPSLRSGELSLTETALTQNPDEEVESKWNFEQTKKLLIDAMTKHCPRGYANLIITHLQIRMATEGGLDVIAPIARELSKLVRESGLLKRICEELEYLYEVHDWAPHKLVIANPAPLKLTRSIYPKMQLNVQEGRFASWLNKVCEDNNLHFIRNDRSDIRLIKSHFPDFIVFDNQSYIFIEFKGKHLLKTPETIRKNVVGQKAHSYFMVYEDEQLKKYMVLGSPYENDEELTEQHITMSLGRKAA